ncbi:MAG: orotidine-5'-phosphate decarboxylase [Verrucomicrobia bacterium]|nr:orotidine-5'-phosphate decarboxylase [Verrucomicrobiota bacterium]
MKSKLIVALDVDGFERAAGLVERLGDSVETYKVGSQLFTRTGPRMVEFLHARGRRCFLDLKFHDIPNTVAKAVESATSLGVAMLTVHTIGGADMLRAAANVPKHPSLLGVTVLTSVGGNVADEVVRRAKLAAECGLEGVVASPHEIKLIRNAVGDTMLIVTPGIRPAWAEAGDQKRMMTPSEAIAAGASFIVVGRPILAAPDPVAAAERVAAEMASACPAADL